MFVELESNALALCVLEYNALALSIRPKNAKAEALDSNFN